MRKITAAAVALGVTGISLIGLAGAAGAAHPIGAADATRPAGAAGAAQQADTGSPAAAHLSGGAAGLTGGTAPDAANGIIKMPTTSYTSPSNQSVRVHALSPNTPVQTQCFTEGQILNNNFYWFRILHNGDLGFVHRDAIVPPGHLRHC